MSQQNTASEEKISRSTCYGRVVGTYIPVAEAFYASFLQLAHQQKAGVVTDQFLRSFLTTVDVLCGSTSEAIAALLKEFSSQREIRETQDHVLVRLVRNRCFETLDALLMDYAQMLLPLGIDLRPIHPQLGDSRLRDEVGALWGLKGANVSVAPDSASRRLSPLKAKEAATMRVLDCLIAMDNLPRELLDYVAGKLFGGEPDYAQQSGFLMNITEALREKRDEAVGLVENFEAVKQKRWDEQRAADFAVIKEAARNSLLKTTDRRTGFGSLMLGVVCGLIDWGAFALGVNNQYIIIGAIVVGAVGIFFLYRGIMQLVRI